MECTPEEAKSFRENLGLVVGNNATLIDEEDFCIACFAQLKEEGCKPKPPSEPPVRTTMTTILGSMNTS